MVGLIQLFDVPTEWNLKMKAIMSDNVVITMFTIIEETTSRIVFPPDTC